MKEELIKQYLELEISAEEMSDVITQARDKSGEHLKNIRIIEATAKGYYDITKEHIIKIADDVMAEKLSPEDASVLAFALMYSEFYTWDEDSDEGILIDTTLFDWDNIDMSHPLTIENFELWKKYLETGKYTLGK